MSDAATLVPQILAAHSAYLAASSDALDHAIRAGELLSLAKQTVGRGNWLKWLETNFPDIPQTTASMYTRLADNRAFLDAEANQQRVANLSQGGKLSIRSALALLPKGKPRGESSNTLATSKPKSTGKRTAAIVKAPASADLAATLANVDPDELFTVLRDTFDKTQLEELVELLEAHLDPALEVA